MLPNEQLEQFGQLLDVVTGGFQRIIDSVSRYSDERSKDHDLLIRIESRLEQSIEQAKIDRERANAHYGESVPVRDDVRFSKAHVTICQEADCLGQVKHHSRVIKFLTNWGWAVLLASQGVLFTGVSVVLVWAIKVCVAQADIPIAH